MKRTVALSVIAVLLMGGVLLAASMGVSETKDAGEKICSDAIGTYAERLQVGPPQRYKSLTLYPVFADEVLVSDVDLTLDRAMAEGLVEIRELKPADVNRVRVRNKGKAPVFIMGGEMLGGAKQDRIVGDDLIVPPKSELVIPVYCVEQGRWVATSETFSSMQSVAGSSVRKARARADQSAVWTRVAEEQRRVDAPSPTGALRSIRESEAVQERAHPYRRAFSDLPTVSPKARGVVACVGGEIIACDLFSSRVLFQRLWPKLLESYVIDALDRKHVDRPLDAVLIKRWLDGVKLAKRTPRETPGQGVLYKLTGGGVIGAALVYDGGVVHMELFRGLTIQPVVEFNPVEFRRNRLEQGQHGQ